MSKSVNRDKAATDQEVLTEGGCLADNPPVDSKESSMEWTCLEDKRNSGDWRVEAIDFDDEGKVYVTIFSGPEAQERAEEYAALKNGQESRLARIAS
jgi:hypothetical protein